MADLIQVVANLGCLIGESPLWHAEEGRLYWVDIATGRMFRYDPAADTVETIYRGEKIGGLTIQVDGSLLLFMEHGAVRQWRDGALIDVVEPFHDEEGSRFNDVIADPLGRVYCGTMPTKDSPGRLYRLDINGTLGEIVAEEGMIPNGLGFTPDSHGLYFVDSRSGSIYLFDYEKESGRLSNRRVFASVPSAEGLPDGLTVDRAGQVWVALCGGGSIVRYTQGGELNGRVGFSAGKITSLTFAGRAYTDIYVTSGGTPEEDGMESGALFRLNLGIQGVPEFGSRILL